jgi:uncharacterized protein YvpB
MLDVPTDLPGSRPVSAGSPALAQHVAATVSHRTGLDLWPAILLAVGLVFIGLAAGFVIGQRSSVARSARSQAGTSSLLSNIDATRDAQQIEIAQLGTELQAARQAASTAQAQQQQAKSKPPLALILDVPLDKQEHSLSCEASAAAMAAKFMGLPVVESDVLSALPRHEDPNLGFRGSVDGLYGGTDDYGTYAEPIRLILSGLGLQVSHLTGGIKEIKQHVREGRPVIAWVTYDMQVQTPRQVTLSSGKTVTLVPYEHAILVVGYNADGLWVHDPYDGTRTWYDEDDFRRSFAYLGNMALVVGPPAAQR